MSEQISNTPEYTLAEVDQGWDYLHPGRPHDRFADGSLPLRGVGGRTDRDGWDRTDPRSRDSARRLEEAGRVRTEVGGPALVKVVKRFRIEIIYVIVAGTIVACTPLIQRVVG